MAAFYDGTIIGLRRELREGRENIARQLRGVSELDLKVDPYLADAKRLVAVFDTLIAALPPESVEERERREGAARTPPVPPARAAPAAPAPKAKPAAARRSAPPTRGLL